MKKIITIITFFIAVTVSAQNFQLHRDFERGHFTTTFELFKPDKYGNTFTFIDFDYNASSGISGSYYEIARVLKTEKMPVGLHVEYNGGLGTFKTPTGMGGFTINDAWIFGANYAKGNAKMGFSTYAGYKAIKNAGEANYQITGTWYVNLIENKLTFSGFADLWSENGLTDKTVFLSEPQLWFHLNKSFSVGGEVELSNNFAYVYEFKVRPTLAIKWNI
ncbi:MAG: hypothetical protein APF83_00580 [Lutibacter sp. BRH_c52]|nr:MAG: hypothetical protein APF83_00580 [Lutibacter sp. BRH_c52]HCE55755.1 DUF5020 domain-containing protein [Lutibacter sp.]